MLYDSGQPDYFSANRRTSALKRVSEKLNEIIKEEDPDSENIITVADVRSQLKNYGHSGVKKNDASIMPLHVLEHRQMRGKKAR